ncbi:hypothetical protein [Rhodococcus erythropolis]
MKYFSSRSLPDKVSVPLFFWEVFDTESVASKALLTNSFISSSEPAGREDEVFVEVGIEVLGWDEDGVVVVDDETAGAVEVSVVLLLLRGCVVGSTEGVVGLVVGVVVCVVV